MSVYNGQAPGQLPWSGPTSRLLRRVYGPRSPASLFIEEARNLRLSHNIQGPPFDPYEYAAALGIRVEQVDDCIFDGVLRFVNNEFLVQLKRDVSPNRKRFTLAHEIAHTFFYDLASHSAKFRDESQFDPEEERLCDWAAAELLMPGAVFARDLSSFQRDGDGRITPPVLLKLRRLYKVSLRAVATRVSFVSRAVGCALWKRQGETVTPEWVTPGSFKPLMLCQTGHSSVELALGREDVVEKLDRVYTGRGPTKYRVFKTSSLALESGLVLSVFVLPESCRSLVWARKRLQRSSRRY